MLSDVDGTHASSATSANSDKVSRTALEELDLKVELLSPRKV
jgi:hypothetical protein